MLQDIVHQPEQLPIVNEELSSTITTQMFDFSDNGLNPETLRSSEVSSCSGCCYDDNSYGADLSFSSFSSFPSDIMKFNTTNNNNNDNNNNNNNNNDNNNLSFLFESQHDLETDISTCLTNFFSSPPAASTFLAPPYLSNQHEQLDLMSLQSQILLTDVGNTNGFSPYSPDSVVALAPQMSLPSVLEEDCLCPLPSYVCLDPSSPTSCSFLDQTGVGGGGGGYMAGNLNSGITMEASGIFSGGIVIESGLQPQELEFQGENGGVYSSESVYSSGEMQALNENQQQLLVSGCVGTAPLTTDITTLEESTYRVGRLSVEERKEKIHRYMKKRNERNFTKKIKYACRKTLADSRPRVRGRFAKNDEFGEATRPSCSNHEDDDDEEVTVKEEEEMINSADIFAHISGVNSFKCNYPIQSWI